MIRRRSGAVAAALAVVLAIAAYTGLRWWHNRPAFGPDALAVTASLELVTNEAAQAAMGKAVYAPYANPDDQLVLGRVSWQPPPQGLAGGYFTILLIDKRTDLKPTVFSVTSPRQESVACGSDGSLNEVAKRYSWLRGAGDRYYNDAWYSSGTAVYAFAADATPLTFVALFPAFDESVPAQFRVATAPVAVTDLLLAIVYVGSDYQVYWAKRLAG